MKLTKQMCDKFELLGEPVKFDDVEVVGRFVNIPGYPEIYYDDKDQLWFDDGSEVLDWEDNEGYKTLWDLIKAMDEVRSKKIKSTK